MWQTHLVDNTNLFKAFMYAVSTHMHADTFAHIVIISLQHC